jgi:RimJ/RimL family protein N-acetyltransferase
VYQAKDGRTITVRRAVRKDIRPAAELWQGLADERRYIATERVTREQRSRWAKSIDDPSALWAMAEVNGELAGWLSLARYGDLKKTRRLRNLGMGVAKQFRGIGVGTALMDYAIGWARHKKVEKIALSVFSTNRKAVGLYKKFGFESEGVRRKQYKTDGRYVDEVMMGLFERPME